MEGAKVYVHDSGCLWRKATVLAALGGGQYRAQLEPWEDEAPQLSEADLGELEVDAASMEGGTLPFQNAGMPEKGFPDMTTLDHLHEAALLHNLRVRFFAGSCPYTYTADIVIALNPYRWFPHLYTDEMRKEYLVFEKSKLPPHAYATSSAAYSGLQETKMDQAILVSGESGAGKTETVKILMAHLALIASSDDQSHIRRIVESNPLLESFGNAQTVRNDNSSRFGKFIELELDPECRLVGSRCRTYLLEKSRVVGQDTGERNYHIFYQMLAASEETRVAIGLEGAAYTRDSMRYTRMGSSRTDTIEGKSDGAKFEETRASLALVGVEGQLTWHLLRSIAGVLLLGQIEFAGGGAQASQDDVATLSPETIAGDAGQAAKALEVDVQALGKALTTRSIKTRHEVLVKPLPPASAVAARDALAKELYSRIFDWLVRRICLATAAPAGETKHFVGLLDIFGFESFAINRFEQLCINYANEKLQQKFTLDVFKAVQQEYTDEGIPWDRIEFKDNAPVLDLIESKLGLIAMLNEECVRPKGSDENFVAKLKTVHKEKPAFSTPKLGAQRELQFTIKHYAGSVTYTTTGWLERNRDAISEDAVSMMRTSLNPVIAEVFAESKGDGASTENTDIKPKVGADSVFSKFRTSLVQLMDTINRTTTQYVRCIKPNKNKSPAEVDNAMVMEQLRCAGVVEAIRISRAGFPARMPLREFAGRFHVLARAVAGLSFKRGCCAVQAGNVIGNQALAKAALEAVSTGEDDAVLCKALMSALSAGGSEERYEIGRTRVYFKGGVLEALEERRALLLQAAANELVRIGKGRKARVEFGIMRRTALRLQAVGRMRKERVAFLTLRHATVLCQALRRAAQARRSTAELRRQRRATQLQAMWRRRVALRHFALVRNAAVRLQAVARQRGCRKQYLRDLAEFKEQAKLENQVKALQARLAAQESASKSMSLSEPPAEIREALQLLAKENAKLRVELERQRTENVALRKENQLLRAGDSNRSYWLASIMRSNRQTAVEAEMHREPNKSPKGGDAHRASLALERHRARTRSGSVHSTSSESEAAHAKGSAGLRQLQLHAPLCDFWEDVLCSGIPLLRSGAEVHIKLGPNVLLVDSRGRNLTWQCWMHRARGYKRSMAFTLERRAELRSGGKRPPPSTDDVPNDGTLGLAFAIRSALTGKYVVEGGVLDWYCMLCTADRPEDAAVFTIVPVHSGSAGSSDEVGGAAAHHAFALRLLGEERMLSLRKDGYTSLVSVPDADSGIIVETMAMSIEYLQPRETYEITFPAKQIGIKVGQSLPLSVVGFASTLTPGQPVEPGPAEWCGRVHVGDIIKSVNGQDISGVPRADALSMIANVRRPVTLGFQVADKDVG